MIVNSLTILFLILLSQNVFATSVTLQQGLSSYTGVTDCDLNLGDGPDTSYCTDTVLAASTQFGGYIRYPIIKFDLSSIPSTATINSAVLSMFYTGNVCEAPTIGVYRVFKPWTTAATWNDWIAPNSEWGTAGAENASDAGTDNSGDGSDYDRVSTANASFSQTNCSEAEWNTFTITTAVQNWVSGTWNNNGVRLGVVSGRFVDGYGYYSSEYATDTSKRPKLDITYTEASAGGGSSTTRKRLRMIQ